MWLFCLLKLLIFSHQINCAGDFYTLLKIPLTLERISLIGRCIFYTALYTVNSQAEVSVVAQWVKPVLIRPVFHIRLLAQVLTAASDLAYCWNWEICLFGIILHNNICITFIKYISIIFMNSSFLRRLNHYCL